MAGSFRDLTVYKKAYALAMEIFEITKKFPSEEKYELTDQTRRSSRAVRKNTGSFVTSRKNVKSYGEKSREVSSKTVKRKYRNIANCFLPTANLRFAT